jgi:tRNA-dihydrouridine synthase
MGLKEGQAFALNCDTMDCKSQSSIKWDVIDAINQALSDGWNVKSVDNLVTCPDCRKTYKVK